MRLLDKMNIKGKKEKVLLHCSRSRERIRGISSSASEERTITEAQKAQPSSDVAAQNGPITPRRKQQQCQE